MDVHRNTLCYRPEDRTIQYYLVLQKTIIIIIIIMYTISITNCNSLKLGRYVYS
jgi:hypothetical protein